MTQYNKKLYYHKNETTPITLYTDTNDLPVSTQYLSLHDNGATVFAGLVATTHHQASDLRVHKNGITYAIAKTSSPWEYAITATDTGAHEIATCLVLDSTTNLYVGGYFNGTATFGSTQLAAGTYHHAFAGKLNDLGEWQWAVMGGGATGATQCLAMGTDSQNNCYIAGYMTGSCTFGSISLTGNGNQDIFVAKINSAGVFQWAVNVGGTNNDKVIGMTVTDSGDCYLTGFYTTSATFGSTTLTSATGSVDIFVAKINSAGAWQWATQPNSGSYGSIHEDWGQSIATDSGGNSYITGKFRGSVTFGATTLNSAGDDDIFIAKLNSSGTWQWAVQATAGAGLDRGIDIATTSNGTIYVTGYFTSSAVFGTTTLTSTSVDTFVAKINTSGAWQWAKQTTGGNTYSQGITLDASENCYLTGYLTGSATFGSKTLTTTTTDTFLAKINSSGAWQWAYQAGASNPTYAWKIKVDSEGKCYIVGHYQGGATTFGTITLASINTNANLFVAKYNP